MSPIVGDLIRGGVGLVVEVVQIIRERRAGKRRRAPEILDRELEATKAKERAHAARRRGRP